MLWKKESNKRDPMYVDLIELNGGKAKFERIVRSVKRENPSAKLTLTKSETMSMKMRNEGNKFFSQGDWKMAMVMYGESLCYAENGTKNISLAYANRSACFLKMKRYNECLVDIELAKEAGYPANMMQTLDRRKDECLEAIGKDGAQFVVNFEPKLSLEVNEQFPSMANVLKIEQDADGYLRMFAKEDIDVGETIVAEKAFMTYLYTRYGFQCNYCLKDHVNLVPCNKCTVAMFCNEECQSNSLHEYECGRRFHDGSTMNGTTMRNVQGCLLAINMFTDADELITFVEQALKSNPTQTPSNLLDEKSKYAAFLKLPIITCQDHMEFLTVLSIAFSTQKMLMKIPKIAAMFNTKKHHRFLAHFTTHHYQLIKANSRVTTKYSAFEYPEVFESRTGLSFGYLKHCCAPNVLSFVFDNNIVVITVRPVKKGEQIMHSYNLPLLTLSKHNRDEMLWLERKIVCKCVRCEGVDASSTQRNRIKKDPDYRYIVSKESIPRTQHDDEETQTLNDTCKRFLQKYGGQSWCNEFGRVVTVYASLIDRK